MKMNREAREELYDPVKKDLKEYFIPMAYKLGQTQGESSSFHETPIYRAVVYAQNYDDAVNKISSMHNISNEKSKRILDDMIKFYLHNKQIVTSKTKILPDAYYDRGSAMDFERKYKLGMGYVKLYDPKKQHKGSWLDFVKGHDYDWDEWDSLESRADRMAKYLISTYRQRGNINWNEIPIISYLEVFKTPNVYWDVVDMFYGGDIPILNIALIEIEKADIALKDKQNLIQIVAKHLQDRMKTSEATELQLEAFNKKYAKYRSYTYKDYEEEILTALDIIKLEELRKIIILLALGPPPQAGTLLRQLIDAHPKVTVYLTENEKRNLLVLIKDSIEILKRKSSVADPGRQYAESELVTRNMTCYKCGEMLQRRLDSGQKTITCPSCQTQIEIKKAEQLDKDLAARLEREQREGVVRDRERREYTKAERITMAKAIAVTTGERMEQGTVITLDDITMLSREEKLKAINILLGPAEKKKEVVHVHKNWTFDDFKNIISRTTNIEDLTELSKHISESEATTPRERIELHKIAEQREVEIRSTVVREQNADTDTDAENLFKNEKKDCKDWTFGDYEILLPGVKSPDDLEEMLDCVTLSNKLSELEIETLRKLIEEKMEE